MRSRRTQRCSSCNDSRHACRDIARFKATPRPFPVDGVVIDSALSPVRGNRPGH
jgi:hypothetical protein